MEKILTRTGDAYKLEMTEDEVLEDIEAGVQDAADRGNIPPLSQNEIQHIFDIFKCKDKIMGVESGKEVCMTYDGMSSKIRRATLS